MKKKIFGIKLGTIITFLTCLIAAVIFWLFAKFSELSGVQQLIGLLFDFRSLL